MPDPFSYPGGFLLVDMDLVHEVATEHHMSLDVAFQVVSRVQAWGNK